MPGILRAAVRARSENLEGRMEICRKEAQKTQKSGRMIVAGVQVQYKGNAY